MKEMRENWKEEEGNYSVYFITDDHGHIKIGKANNVWNRMKELQTGNPYKLRLLLCVELSSEKEAFQLETLLHQQFQSEQMEGEWFKASAIIDFLTQPICIVQNFRFYGREIV